VATDWLGRKKEKLECVVKDSPCLHTGVEEFSSMIACYNTKIYRQALKEISTIKGSRRLIWGRLDF
jgi:hypothetical protein